MGNWNIDLVGFLQIFNEIIEFINIYIRVVRWGFRSRTLGSQNIFSQNGFVQLVEVNTYRRFSGTKKTAKKRESLLGNSNITISYRKALLVKKVDLNFIYRYPHFIEFTDWNYLNYSK